MASSPEECTHGFGYPSSVRRQWETHVCIVLESAGILFTKMLLSVVSVVPLPTQHCSETQNS